MTILRTQEQCVDAAMPDLVETYNAMTGKSIKRFESLEVGRSRTCAAIMEAIDADAHSGVPKGGTPQAITKDELAAKLVAKGKPAPKEAVSGSEGSVHDGADASLNHQPTVDEANQQESNTMAAQRTKTARRGATAAKKARTTAKKAAKERRPTYTTVTIAEPTVVRRPQENSKRTEVLNALRKLKKCSLDKLSEAVGFDCRPYVHKLVAQGWAEVAAAKV